MERIIDVARYIFREYEKLSSTPIDEMMLHKLLYFAQRESFAVTGAPMFEENFEGWKYGPVSRVVRHCYMHGGLDDSEGEIGDISPENAYIAKNVLMQYGVYESWKLSELSHKELSWRNARRGLLPEQNGTRILSMDDIRKDAEKVRPYDPIWDMYYDEFDNVEEA